MITENYDLDIDSTLGGNNASDYVIPSQKAIKSYVDNNTGSTVDQVFDPTSQAAQSGVAIYGVLTDGSISPTFGNSLDISSANLYYDSDDNILYNSTKTDFPEISINSNYSFVLETNAETGDDELVISSNITSDSIRWSAEGGIFVNTSVSGGQFTYNGNEVATLNDIPSLTNYVTTNTDQDITGVKTYVGQKRIGFKQSGSNDKLGFTLYTNNNVEKGYLEFNPTNTIDGAPLMTLGNYASSAAAITHVGFRKYSSVSGASGAYNLLAPLISNAKTPFNLTTTYTNFYLPLGFTDGTTMVTTANTGVVDLSSILPSEVTETTVSNWGFTKNTGTVTSVNNVSPVSGNVTLSIPTVTDTYSSTSSDGMSGKAVASAISGKQDTLVSGTNIKTINSISLLGNGNISVLQNTATGTHSLTLLGDSSTTNECVNIGYFSAASSYSNSFGAYATARGAYSSAIGIYTEATGDCSSAIGYYAEATADSSIQLGYGTNSTANSLSVGFYNDSTTHYNWVLLNGTTGLIPDARLSSNIARTSQIPSISNLADKDLSNLSSTGQNIADTTKDQNTNTRLKYWTGTQAQYDAIATKDANTLYNVEDTTSPIISILDSLYPVGAIYIGTMSVCPLATLGIGTWQLVAQDRVLQGAGTRGAVGTTISESLPNITGTAQTAPGKAGYTMSGAFGQYSTSTTQVYANGAASSSATNQYGIDIDASRVSSTYQNNAPVQQDGYLVNIWERIA